MSDAQIKKLHPDAFENHCWPFVGPFIGNLVCQIMQPCFIVLFNQIIRWYSMLTAGWHKSHFITEMKRRVFARLAFSETISFGFLLTIAAFTNSYAIFDGL